MDTLTIPVFHSDEAPETGYRMGGGIAGAPPELSNLGGSRSTPTHQQVENEGVQRLGH